MKLIFTLAIFFCTALHTFGQINMADSTVQAITYWDKGETQSYTVSNEQIKITGADTTSRELTTYDVDITVLDSTANGYTVAWVYRNLTTTNTNETYRKLMNISEGMKVIFKTDELGAFVEVVNWKEISDYIRKATATLRKDFKGIPEMENLLKKLEATYSTKQAIETASIKDIKQFHTFHGGKYKQGEVLEGQLKVPNIYGKEPFDSDIIIYLDEINEEDNNFILRAEQVINKEQLLDATFAYLSSTSKGVKKMLPKREDLKELKNETFVGSRIHGSGWVIYSIQTTTVTAENVTQVDERIIDIK